MSNRGTNKQKPQLPKNVSTQVCNSMTTAKPKVAGSLSATSLTRQGYYLGFFPASSGFLRPSRVLQLTQFLFSEEQREQKSSEFFFSACSGDLRKQGEQMGKVVCAKVSLNPASHSTEDLEGTLQLSHSLKYKITFLVLVFYFVLFCGLFVCFFKSQTF